MSALKGKSFKGAVNVLKDDELSDLTKQEIVFWSHKLNITPSQLFSIPKDELDARLKNYFSAENNTQKAQKQPECLEQLGQTKNKISEFKKKTRLAGGQVSPIRNILDRAAEDIANAYGINIWDDNPADDQNNNSIIDDDGLDYSDEEESFNPFDDLDSAAEDSADRALVPADRTFNAGVDGTFNVASDRTFNFSANRTPPPDYRLNSTAVADNAQPPFYRNTPPRTPPPWHMNTTPTSPPPSPITPAACMNLNLSSIENNQGEGRVTASSRTFDVPAENLSSDDLDITSFGTPQMASTPVKHFKHGEGELGGIGFAIHSPSPRRPSSPPGPSGLHRYRTSPGQMNCTIHPPSDDSLPYPYGLEPTGHAGCRTLRVPPPPPRRTPPRPPKLLPCASRFNPLFRPPTVFSPPPCPPDPDFVSSPQSPRSQRLFPRISYRTVAEAFPGYEYFKVPTPPPGVIHFVPPSPGKNVCRRLF